MLKVSFFKIKKSHPQYLEELSGQMPVADRKRILKLDRKEDRLRTIIGRLLLKKLLMAEGYPANVLKGIKPDKHDRPFIDHKIDFNIAHSGKYVICGISKNGRVGVDIEKKRPVKIDEFNVFLSEKELEKVLKNKKPLELFFKLWAQKEAVSKANGKGIGALLPKVNVKKNMAFCEKEKWFLRPLKIDKKYASYIACKNKAGPEPLLTRVKLKDLLKNGKTAKNSN